MAGHSQEQDSFAHALASNTKWAQAKRAANPSFFADLAKGQSPKILWIGCSDSRMPESTLLALDPGQVFVHRNIANILHPDDINAQSVIEYAVVHLRVEHVVLCGHTGCGGVNATLARAQLGEPLEGWLKPLAGVMEENKEALGALEGDAKMTKLAQLNVQQGLGVLKGNAKVKAAIEERGMLMHGLIYNLATGLLEIVE